MTFTFLTTVDLKVFTFSARTETFCPLSFPNFRRPRDTIRVSLNAFHDVSYMVLFFLVSAFRNCFQKSENPFFPASFLSSPLLLNLSKVIYFASKSLSCVFMFLVTPKTKRRVGKTSIPARLCRSQQSRSNVCFHFFQNIWWIILQEEPLDSGAVMLPGTNTAMWGRLVKIYGLVALNYSTENVVVNVTLQYLKHI